MTFHPCTLPTFPDHLFLNQVHDRLEEVVVKPHLVVELVEGQGLSNGVESLIAQATWVDFAKPLIGFIFALLFSRVLLAGNWVMSFVIAVPICLLFYAVFFLLRHMPVDFKNRLLVLFPEPVILDELGYQMTLFGFLFLSVGIITGAVWANSAWGRYWGWDPKETWSLITWFIYATLLHARLMRGWRGKRIAYLTLVGFAAVLFTYFGVNLLPGLHSYGNLGQ